MKCESCGVNQGEIHQLDCPTQNPVVQKGRQMTWEDIKRMGSDHYKTGLTEPIDLYKDAGVLKPFALCSIIKYAYRNIFKTPVSNKDMDKIVHYVNMLKVVCGDGK